MNDSYDYEKYRKRAEASYRNCMISLIGMIICLIMAVILCASCGTHERIITVPEVHHEYHHTTDTIREKDSVKIEKTTTIRELDSAAMAKYGIQLRNAERAWLVETSELRQQISELMKIRDSLAVRSDSIPVPYPVEVKVPAEINGWQWAQIWFGRITMATIALLIGGWLLYRLVIKKYF